MFSPVSISAFVLRVAVFMLLFTSFPLIIHFLR